MPLCESRSHSHSSCRERVHRLAVLQLAVPLPSIPFPPPLLSFHSLQLFHPWFRRFIIRASGCWRRVSDACYTRGARGREGEGEETYVHYPFVRNFRGIENSPSVCRLATDEANEDEENDRLGTIPRKLRGSFSSGKHSFLAFFPVFRKSLSRGKCFEMDRWFRNRNRR